METHLHGSNQTTKTDSFLFLIQQFIAKIAYILEKCSSNSENCSLHIHFSHFFPTKRCHSSRSHGRPSPIKTASGSRHGFAFHQIRCIDDALHLTGGHRKNACAWTRCGFKNHPLWIKRWSFPCGYIQGRGPGIKYLCIYHKNMY